MSSPAKWRGTSASRSSRPSPGFLAIVLAYVGLIAFLVWGWQKPPLDRVWELHHELKIGMIGKLDNSDHQLLKAALTRHSALADALLSDGSIGLISAHSHGWLETPQATIIRTASAPHPCNIEFEVRIPPELFPLTVQILGQGWQDKLSIQQEGTAEFPLPKNTKGDEIITLEVASKEGAQETATLGIRVGFSCTSEKVGAADDADAADDLDD